MVVNSPDGRWDLKGVKSTFTSLSFFFNTMGHSQVSEKGGGPHK